MCFLGGVMAQQQELVHCKSCLAFTGLLLFSPVCIILYEVIFSAETSFFSQRNYIAQDICLSLVLQKRQLMLFEGCSCSSPASRFRPLANRTYLAQSTRALVWGWCCLLSGWDERRKSNCTREEDNWTHFIPFSWWSGFFSSVPGTEEKYRFDARHKLSVSSNQIGTNAKV